MNNKTIHAYKGVDKNLCGYGGFQYEVGKEYDCEGEILKADTWYTLRNGKFVEVE